jgi:3-methyladenine DNA glycosylase/8-oxoguanine DNA glycosylase
MTAARRSLPIRRPLHLGRTLEAVRRGRGDPALLLADAECWRATRTPAGPATLHLRVVGGRLEAEAWGPGRGWALHHAGDLVGEGDDDSGFRPGSEVLRAASRSLRGLRIGRTGAVAEALVPTILEQKVAGVEARRSWRALVRRLGERAPGPAPHGLTVPPEPARLAATPTWVFHRCGIERKRADTVRRAMARGGRVDEVVALPLDEAYRRLRALPGVGPWSAAEEGRVALGDADAVSVGDHHLPSQAAWALAGEPTGTDERMLELLEPYRGHRGRVLRLLTVAAVGPPRRAPRAALRSFTDH